MGNLRKKALLDLAVPLGKDVLSKLASKATSSEWDKSERKISGHGAVRAGKGFILLIWNKDMDDIIKIVKLLEDSGLWARSLMFSDLHSETKGSRFESGC